MPGPNRRNLQHGWLGISVGPAGEGPEVQGVSPDSAAEKAGLKNGDQIKRLDGAEIHSADQLIETLSKMPPNKKVTLVVGRKDKQLELEATLGRSPGRLPQDNWGGGPFSDRRWGFAAVDSARSGDCADGLRRPAGRHRRPLPGREYRPGPARHQLCPAAERGSRNGRENPSPCQDPVSVPVRTRWPMSLRIGSLTKGKEMKSVRLPVFVTVAALCVALALGAFARRGSAAEGLWQTDFKAAQAKAKQEKKYLLVDFTGSDWCGWCIKLHNEVFDKEPFKAEAPKQFVLVELDFPHEKEQSDELKKQNKELSEKYNIEGFPTVLLLDAEGQVIARTGYREGGPEDYLKQLAEFPKIYRERAGPEGQARQDPRAGSRQALGRDRRRLPEARQRIGRSRGLEQGDYRPGPRQQGRPEGQVRVPADPRRGRASSCRRAKPPRPRKCSTRPWR